MHDDLKSSVRGLHVVRADCQAGQIVAAGRIGDGALRRVRSNVSGFNFRTDDCAAGWIGSGSRDRSGLGLALRVNRTEQNNKENQT